jgi:methyl-accepting chemotaxis protein
MSASLLITVGAAVGGFLITAAGAIATWAALRVGRQAATLADLKEAADAAARLATARKDELDNQDRRIAELQLANTEKDKKIAELDGRVHQLTELVTARPAFDQLTASFAIMAQRMDSRITEALAQADQIRTELREVHETVRANADLITAKEAGHGGPRRAG